jgi:DNA-binding NarL/FixJ family response regulator
MIRVLIADDSDQFRSALCRFLKVQPSVHIVGQATNLLETIRLARKLMPDVVLLDLHLNGAVESDAEYVKAKLLFCAERILCMSIWNDEESKALAKSYGAFALLDKTRLAQVLMPALADLAMVSSLPNVSPS